MADGNSPTTSSVFDLLNQWRHLPSYSLETRAAPFFAVFLRDVLSAHFGEDVHETLIPEFPLRVGTLYKKEELEEMKSKPSPDQSYNVDYLAFGQDGKTAYLVELKTDLDSVRPEQIKYLRAAKQVANRDGFFCLVEGVKQVAKKSDKKQKYVHLLHRLADNGLNLVDVPDNLYDKSFPKVTRGWTDALDKQKVTPEAISEARVVFVQPAAHGRNHPEFDYIYFNKVADAVQSRGDLGCMFANHLRQWTEPAGSLDPRNFGLNRL